VCNLYSITTNQAAIAALFRVVNRYVGNLAPMPGVFPDSPAPVINFSKKNPPVDVFRRVSYALLSRMFWGTLRD
jgi:putative SOS response-associated peptidase YedK